jgi:hypothetical protein
MNNEVKAKFNILSKQLMKQKISMSERKERLYDFAEENKVEISELRILVNKKANWTMILGILLILLGIVLFTLKVANGRMGITGIIGLISGGSMIYQATQIRNIIPANMDLLDS